MLLLKLVALNWAHKKFQIHPSEPGPTNIKLIALMISIKSR